MIYEGLAKYYDDLVGDEEATLKWVDLTKKFCPKGNLLELACGSGEISYKLQQEGYDLLATDFSSSMIERLNSKYPSVATQVLDMREFTLDKKFDGVICYCDSINYLNSMEEVKRMFQSVKDCLSDEGIFIFDMHTLDRLEEFSELYIEEGELDVPYQWTIQSIDNEIHQHFAFFEEDRIIQEQHIQTVFHPNDIMTSLYELGFRCEAYTDFEKEGIQEGEKLFIVARREKC
ncbi:class I SAM-dependent DNA methyltransferase [Anaerorhabdus furcosa]|uniref:Methyltransferase domain-containing protein n=1 Tax=Anaerorhabdus furcosa TaxID=118967 RepID=A0A1T4NIQ1_9FIRM|nr:class I SAM-dependent methyltransferase [Anaerorhabdus furcosa]SJZ79129.1 Methyltransferase domain-containing protein [Anaerorhabdus furcosa]